MEAKTLPFWVLSCLWSPICRTWSVLALGGTVGPWSNLQVHHCGSGEFISRGTKGELPAAVPGAETFPCSLGLEVSLS